MFNKTIENLSFRDIEWIIQNGITENQNLEFKREAWGYTDANKKEMLRDIISMANKYGGYFIIGIEEESDTGRAIGLNNIPNAENERDRILSSLFANTQPRLRSVKIRVFTNNGINILVIGVPNSFNKPHMITFENMNQFWVRHDRQKMLMTIDEIQESVINTINITKNADLFFTKRKQAIIDEAGGVPIIVIGALPVAAQKEIIDITDIQLRELLKNSPLIRNDGVSFRFGDRLVKPSYFGLSVSIENYSKIELHRNGYIEGSLNLANHKESGNDITRLDDGRVLRPQVIRNWVVVEILFSFVKQVKQIYSYIGYDGLVYIFCGLYNIKGFSIRPHQESQYNLIHELQIWNSDHLEIGPVAFTEIDDVVIAKTFGDRIWQSFGYEQEPYFNGRVFSLA